MIDIDAVTKRYGSATVLDEVSLQIPAGGVISLIGANGAGKSTLLSIVGRLLEPDEGRVHVDDLDVSSASGTVLARRLSVLRQDNHLPVRLSVRELVRFGRFPHCGGRLGPEDHERVESALSYLELEPMAERRLDQLSGGQRQRAHIAMVLAQDTRYVLLDEPLNNLDMRHAAQTMDMIRRMAEDLGKTVVVVLHDINVAAHHSDRIIAMRLGRIVADGAPGDIVDRDVLQEVFGLDVPIAQTEVGPVAMHFGRQTPGSDGLPSNGHRPVGPLRQTVGSRCAPCAVRRGPCPWPLVAPSLDGAGSSTGPLGCHRHESTTGLAVGGGRSASRIA